MLIPTFFILAISVSIAFAQVSKRPSKSCGYDLAHIGDSYEHMSVWDRCTTRGVPGRMLIATSAATRRIKGISQSEALHVAERFTPSDTGTIQYEVTIEDPNEYTKPWKVAIPLTRDAEEYIVYEYARPEGNQAVENVLRGGRAQETGPAQPR